MGICYMSQGTQTGALYQPREVGWLGDGRKVQEGGGIVHLCLTHVVV